MYFLRYNIEVMKKALNKSDKNNPEKRFDRLESMIDTLAQITAKGFQEASSELHSEIDKLNKKIDYRFDSLSNRIDDLVMNKATREQVKIIEVRIERIEKKLGLK